MNTLLWSVIISLIFAVSYASNCLVHEYKNSLERYNAPTKKKRFW